MKSVFLIMFFCLSLVSNSIYLQHRFPVFDITGGKLYKFYNGKENVWADLQIISKNNIVTLVTPYSNQMINILEAKYEYSLENTHVYTYVSRDSNESPLYTQVIFEFDNAGGLIYFRYMKGVNSTNTFIIWFPS